MFITTIKVPAKLIITGEHSAIYGKTALTGAINKYTFCTECTRESYTPNKFIEHCISSFCDKYNIKKDNIFLNIKSDVMQNSGLGSSASVIISILMYLYQKFQIQETEDEILSLAQQIENYTHGKSSGIDIKTVFYGDILKFTKNTTQINYKTEKLLAEGGKMYNIENVIIIHTGVPKFSTKEVVKIVEANFKNDVKLWNEFDIVANNIIKSIESKRANDLKYYLSQNSRLLSKIGIVSEKVQYFIMELEEIGIFAKVCGAGTIGKSDDNCGYVCIFHQINEDELSYLTKIAEQYEYRLEFVEIDKHGWQSFEN